MNQRFFLGLFLVLLGLLVFVGTLAVAIASYGGALMLVPTGLFLVGGRLMIANATEETFTALGVITIFLSLVSLYFIFFYAPTEEQMGIVQKIFYFHVPSAYAMYVAFIVSSVGSALYLFRREDRFDAVAVAGAQVGLMFCLIVLITGPIWARKAWGTYWTWDPRLTTTLLIGMIYTAFNVLRSFGQAGESEKKFASALGFMGLLLIPVIHYSVQRWRGQHPTVISSQGGGLHPDMVPALVSGFAFFTALCIFLIWARTRAERQRQRLVSLELDAAESGLLEEGI